MRLRVKNGQLSVEQSTEERVILYLDSLKSLPESEYDESGYRRTANGISAAIRISYPTLTKLLNDMCRDGVLELYSYKYRTDARQGNVYANVYILTPDGQKLAQEIRRRLV